MIHILTGRQTDPLEEQILAAAIENYQNNPDQATFIIVPNHIKFTTEVRAINKLAMKQGREATSVKNLHILSFSRLAWFFLKDDETKLPQTLDDAAVAMLLSKIITAKHDQLQLLQHVQINPGLVKQLYDTILQVYAGKLDLGEVVQSELDAETQAKVHDLKLIYDAFLAAIKGRFSTKNEIQLKLNSVLAQNKQLAKCAFYFTGFSHFSLQETLTIKLLMLKANHLSLAFKTRVGEIDPTATAGDYDYVIQQTISRLIHFVKARQLQCSYQAIPLQAVQSNAEKLNSLWTGVISSLPSLSNVQLVKADSRYAEAYFVAQTIYQQVALGHYRYQDFLVIAPNLHEYETYLGPILRQMAIPYFNDLQQEMKYHPLVILIEHLAALVTHPFNTPHLLAILKTQLLIPNWYHDSAAYLHDVDELENFVLAHGINHELWRRPLTSFVKTQVIQLDYENEALSKLEQLRQFFVTSLDQLLPALEKARESQKALTIFFNFLVKNGVAKKLEVWREQASDQGDLQLAQQPEQLWNLLIQLLHDYLLINPDEFSVTDFFQLLINGFRAASFSQIPSTLDAVNISEIGMVQQTGYAQVFIIGATSGNLPAIEQTPGFLSSENIANMSQTFETEHYLEDQQQLHNLDQDYQFGAVLALATEKVYLSYPVLNAANEPLEPSLYYHRLQAAGANVFQQHDLPTQLQDILSFLTNRQASLGYLAFLDTTMPGPQVSELLQLATQALKPEAVALQAAAHFDNNPVAIGAKLAKALYGTHLNSSVSQLETYYENSYEYFLTYGLKLRNRAENQFDVIQAGNYFHETFDKLVKVLAAKQLDLATLSTTQLLTTLTQIHQDMRLEGAYEQLGHELFNQYLFSCLDRTTIKVAKYWQQTLSQTPLRPAHSELSFGPGEAVKGLSFQLTPDTAIAIRGKIDRVDLATMPGELVTLGQVIDYKSSAKKFDLGLFYSGISLQMVAYLDVLAHNQAFFAGGQPLALLGAFYQTVTRQLSRLNGKDLLTPDLTLKPTQFDGQPRLTYTGLINNDPKRLKVAESRLSTAASSSGLYSGIKTKRDGNFSLPKNRNFNDAELADLLQYGEYLISQAGKTILSGELELNPYQYGKTSSALTYSDFKDIFFFDPMLPNNRYHMIENLAKPELMTKIRAALEGKQV